MVCTEKPCSGNNMLLQTPGSPSVGYDAHDAPRGRGTRSPRSRVTNHPCVVGRRSLLVCRTFCAETRAVPVQTRMAGHPLPMPVTAGWLLTYPPGHVLVAKAAYKGNFVLFNTTLPPLPLFARQMGVVQRWALELRLPRSKPQLQHPPAVK